MKKGLETWFYSSLGVVTIFLAIVALNALAARAKQRVDLTADRVYTLSAGTRAILGKLDTPVQIRFYCTRSDNSMPVALKTYARSVEDLLGEYQQASKGLIEVQQLDPTPDSDAADSARLDGVEPQQRPDGEPVYLGLSVSMLDQKEVVPFLTPDRERLLEYDISRAITRVAASEKPVIGVMSPLAVAGVQPNPLVIQANDAPQPAWALYSELASDFTLKAVEMNAEQIPDDVKVLLLIHPHEISDGAQYAIDQFVLRGGKLIAFLDPQCLLDPKYGPRSTKGPSISTLDKLLPAWGITFDSTRVVADLDYLTRVRQGRQAVALTLNENAMNKEDVVSANTDNLLLLFAGAFGGKPAAGLEETVLVKSSLNSQLVDPVSAHFDGEKVIRDFARSGVEYPLAVRLTGKFKTAFPEGKPKGAVRVDAPKGKAGAQASSSAPAEGLKESAVESAVILVGDADFIQDRIAVQETMSPFGNNQRIVTPVNGNLSFAQGAIEQLAGDDDLIAVRSRASRERQFTVVKELQARAESVYQSKIKELETSLGETRGKLGELQRTTDSAGGQRFILSPEQQAEIAKFKTKEADTRQALKQERKKLRADIDSLENRIQWLNIGLMPAMVAVAGVGLAAARQSRRAAR